VLCVSVLSLFIKTYSSRRLLARLIYKKVDIIYAQRALLQTPSPSSSSNDEEMEEQWHTHSHLLILFYLLMIITKLKSTLSLFTTTTSQHCLYSTTNLWKVTVKSNLQARLLLVRSNCEVSAPSRIFIDSVLEELLFDSVACQVDCDILLVKSAAQIIYQLIWLVFVALTQLSEGNLHSITFLLSNGSANLLFAAFCFYSVISAPNFSNSCQSRNTPESELACLFLVIFFILCGVFLMVLL
jgi:hypothetical protein